MNNLLFESFMFICIENMFDTEKVVCIKIFGPENAKSSPKNWKTFARLGRRNSPFSGSNLSP